MDSCGDRRKFGGHEGSLRCPRAHRFAAGDCPRPSRHHVLRVRESTYKKTVKFKKAFRYSVAAAIACAEHFDGGASCQMLSSYDSMASKVTIEVGKDTRSARAWDGAYPVMQPIMTGCTEGHHRGDFAVRHRELQGLVHRGDQAQESTSRGPDCRSGSTA